MLNINLSFWLKFEAKFAYQKYSTFKLIHIDALHIAMVAI